MTTTTLRNIVLNAPEASVCVFRPHALERAARYFKDNFKARCLFAVKTNPEPLILQTLEQTGMTQFDVASLEEVKLAYTTVPNAELFFMHPVKSRHAIREAYHTYGVRHFSLDSHAELQKILEETGHATDLNLHLRLSIPNSYAELALADKFGVSLTDAPELLAELRKVAAKVGICFHVGSQCMHPDAYRIAMRMAGGLLRETGIEIEFFNVGGGFPSVYPGMIPPDMQSFFDAIHAEFDDLNQGRNMTLLAEPGRALVAESGSVVVRVDLRKDDVLYINDGTYGALFDAGTPRFIYPTQLLANRPVDTDHLMPFSFYGPTCDSLDFMKGPFYLPQDVQEGDYIEIGQLGAYGKTMATRFNGFAPQDETVVVSDAPLMSMYDDAYEEGDVREGIVAA